MKNFQGIASTTTAKVILGALLTVFACAAANAQPAFTGKFVLPQEVRWNQAVLPAGEYSIEMSSLSAPAVLRSKTTNKTYYTTQPIFSDCQNNAPLLHVKVRGNQRSVSSLDIPEVHRTLIFEAPSKADRESLAKAGISETVVVEIARK